MEEFAVWLGCNPMTQELTLCAINNVLILPGLTGMMLLFIAYMLFVPILIVSLLKRAYLKLRQD